MLNVSNKGGVFLNIIGQAASLVNFDVNCVKTSIKIEIKCNCSLIFRKTLFLADLKFYET